MSAALSFPGKGVMLPCATTASTSTVKPDQFAVLCQFVVPRRRWLPSFAGRLFPLRYGSVRSSDRRSRIRREGSERGPGHLIITSRLRRKVARLRQTMPTIAFLPDASDGQPEGSSGSAKGALKHGKTAYRRASPSNAFSLATCSGFSLATSFTSSGSFFRS
jgi:hypothetical protein